MKPLTIFSVFMLFSFMLSSQNVDSGFFRRNPSMSIIPMPYKMQMTRGFFKFSSKTKCYVSETGLDLFKTASLLTSLTGIKQPVVKKIYPHGMRGQSNLIIFQKIEDDSLGEEGYRMSISSERILIGANTSKGFFYAVQTIIQLLPPVYSGQWSAAIGKTLNNQPTNNILPSVEIMDKPRFGYRGMHLDVSRHFFPVSFVKKYIDALALHKFNTFHWHLTDDQGWRIEIKQFPKLTQIGSKRKETMEGSYSKEPRTFDGVEYGGFYTQEEIKDVINYAQDRFITIVPEIEMPGHALAALSAYPEFSCDPSKKYEAATTWGIFEDVFCPNEKTFDFIDKVLTEVTALFPSKYIHVGGDECPKTAWKNSAFCQDLMKKLGLKNEEELQSYFIQRVEKMLTAKGKKLLGWDEILEGGLSPTATVMSWRGEKGGIEAAKQSHDVIMTPSTYVYFDYYQANPDKEPLAIGGFLPLRKVYNYEPYPNELTPEQTKYIIGVQGNIWTEYLPTESSVEYMVFPRAVALSETAWSAKENKNWESFSDRLSYHIKRLEAMKINYSKRIFDPQFNIKLVDSEPAIELMTELNGGDIFYTTDNSQPSTLSNKYTVPIPFSKDMTLKAIVVRDTSVICGDFEKKFRKSSVLKKAYSLKNAPSNAPDENTEGLTDGVDGSTKSTFGWTGFRQNDMEAVFDFGTPRAFKDVKINFLNKPNQSIYIPDYVIISVSNDGKTWQDINRADFLATRDPGNYTRAADLPFAPVTKPKRYLKVFAKNTGIVPKGDKRAGQPAWLYADEIVVE